MARKLKRILVVFARGWAWGEVITKMIIVFPAYDRNVIVKQNITSIVELSILFLFMTSFSWCKCYNIIDEDT